MQSFSSEVWVDWVDKRLGASRPARNGNPLAEGMAAEVLSGPHVIAAYLGTKSSVAQADTRRSGERRGLWCSTISIRVRYYWVLSASAFSSL